jgi:hypothetical protein
MYYRRPLVTNITEGDDYVKKNKHLTEDECRKIEHLLREQVSLGQISSMLGISVSTILWEARIFAQTRDKFERYLIRNNCVKRRDCGKHYLCTDNQTCNRNCSMCALCNELCDNFTPDACFKLCESPYGCDGCSEEYTCFLRKVFHLNKMVHEAWREKVSDSESGAVSTGSDSLTPDRFISTSTTDSLIR